MEYFRFIFIQETFSYEEKQFKYRRYKRVVAKELILYIEYFVICMKYTFFYRRKYHFLQFVIRKNFLKLNLY